MEFKVRELVLILGDLPIEIFGILFKAFKAGYIPLRFKNVHNYSDEKNSYNSSKVEDSKINK